MLKTSYSDISIKILDGGYETDINYLLDKKISKNEEITKIEKTNILTVKFGTSVKDETDILWYPTDTIKILIQ